MFNCTENKGNNLIIEMDNGEAVLTVSSKEIGCDLVVCLTKEDSLKLKDALEGRPKYFLNQIKEGSRLTFVDAAPGTVRDIWTKCTYGQTGNIAHARYRVVHDNGHESYHTYRADGRSQDGYDQDILTVENE